LTHNRRPSSRRASTKAQGKREEGRGKYWDDTEHGVTRKHSPAVGRGVARGCAKDPTDDPAELDVLF
jgi:hypothetical protein